jgi:hypothetical protein
MNIAKFNEFFDHCIGNWQSERTYHYLTQNEIERSRTEFEIIPLTSELKQKVLSDNLYPDQPDLNIIPGFSLGFYTISEKGEEVSQQLNLLFVVKQENGTLLGGDYLRDRAYEEAKPIISDFSFDTASQELLMTTRYTRVVSVDSITLINPDLRIRQILNYQRPPEGRPLDTIVLAGFGVEQKLISPVS